MNCDLCAIDRYKWTYIYALIRTPVKKMFAKESPRSGWTPASHPTWVQLSDGWIKRVWIIHLGKQSDCLQSFLPSTLICKILCENCFRGKRWNQRRELNPLSFYYLFTCYILRTRQQMVTLFVNCFTQKTWKKIKMLAYSGIHRNNFYAACQSDGAFGPISEVK